MSLNIYVLANGGYGYEVNLRGIVIKQENLPATDGDYQMSQNQATLLGTTVELKLKNRLRASLTFEQMRAIIEGKKTPTQIVNQELGL